MEKKGKMGMSFRWLCFGLLLTAAVFRFAEEGGFAFGAQAASDTPQHRQEQDFPAFSYTLPKIPKLTFSPADAALVEIDDSAGLFYDAEDLISAPLKLDPSVEGPVILIIHTHSTEAYTPTSDTVYEASASYRTKDTSYNVVRVGQAMAELLNARGIKTIHDTALHDDSGYDDSYERTAEVISSYLQEYPSIQMVIDVHRDAVADSQGAQLALCSEVEGQRAASLLFVMGTDAAGLEHPHWQTNLSMALKLQALCEKEAPGLFRELSLRAQRYNQHLTPYSLLLEVGTAGNTLPEALLSAEFFADQLAQLLLNGS